MSICSPSNNSKFLAEMKKRLQAQEKKYNKIIHELKPQVFKEAAAFVSKQAINVTKLLSKEHHFVIKQFGK